MRGREKNSSQFFLLQSSGMLGISSVYGGGPHARFSPSALSPRELSPSDNSLPPPISSTLGFPLLRRFPSTFYYSTALLPWAAGPPAWSGTFRVRLGLQTQKSPIPRHIQANNLATWHASPPIFTFEYSNWQTWHATPQNREFQSRAQQRGLKM